MLTQAGFAPVAFSAGLLTDAIVNLLGGGAADPTTLKLFQNNVTVSPATLLADLTEADFTGYAGISITEASWAAAVLQPDGTARAINTTVRIFNATGTAIPNTVYGWYLINDGGSLCAMGNFPTPLLMDANGKYIAIELALTMPAGSPANITDVESNT